MKKNVDLATGGNVTISPGNLIKQVKKYISIEIGVGGLMFLLWGLSMLLYMHMHPSTPSRYAHMGVAAIVVGVVILIIALIIRFRK